MESSTFSAKWPTIFSTSSVRCVTSWSLSWFATLMCTNKQTWCQIKVNTYDNTNTWSRWVTTHLSATSDMLTPLWLKATSLRVRTLYTTQRQNQTWHKHMHKHRHKHKHRHRHRCWLMQANAIKHLLFQLFLVASDVLFDHARGPQQRKRLLHPDSAFIIADHHQVTCINVFTQCALPFQRTRG